MLCMIQWMKDRIFLYKHIFHLHFLVKILLFFKKEHPHSKDETWIEDPRLPFGNLTLHWAPSNSGNISLMLRAAVFFDALSFLATA